MKRPVGFIIGLALCLGLVGGCLNSTSTNDSHFVGTVRSQRSLDGGSKRALTESDRQYQAKFNLASLNAAQYAVKADAEALKGNADTAESLYRQAILLSPRTKNGHCYSSTAPYRLAYVYLQEERWQDAIDTVVGQLEGGNVVECYPILSIAYCELGQLEKAVQYAPKQDPERGGLALDVWDMKPGGLCTQGRNAAPPPKTLKELKAAAYFALGMSFNFGEDDLDSMRALDYKQIAAEAFPTCGQYTVHYAQNLQAEQYYDDAIDWLNTTKKHGYGVLPAMCDQLLEETRSFREVQGANKGRKPKK